MLRLLNDYNDVYAGLTIHHFWNGHKLTSQVRGIYGQFCITCHADMLCPANMGDRDQPFPQAKFRCVAAAKMIAFI